MLSTNSAHKQVLSRSILLILSLIFSIVVCSGQDQELSNHTSISDGILSIDEDVDSSIFQSHGIDRTNGIMYDKKALKDYITAQIESLKYSCASNSSNIPLDLKITGSQIQIGTKVVTRRYDYSGKKIKVPVYKERWETYYVDVFVPVYRSGRSSRVIHNSSDPYGGTTIIPGKAPKFKKKRVRQKRLISSTIVRYKTKC